MVKNVQESVTDEAIRAQMMHQTIWERMGIANKKKDALILKQATVQINDAHKNLFQAVEKGLELNNTI